MNSPLIILNIFEKVFYENTYQLDPPAKFRPDKVKPIIEKVLEANLEGMSIFISISCSSDPAIIFWIFRSRNYR